MDSPFPQFWDSWNFDDKLFFLRLWSCSRPNATLSLDLSYSTIYLALSAFSSFLRKTKVHGFTLSTILGFLKFWWQTVFLRFWSYSRPNATLSLDLSYSTIYLALSIGVFLRSASASRMFIFLGFWSKICEVRKIRKWAQFSKAQKYIWIFGKWGMFRKNSHGLLRFNNFGKFSQNSWKYWNV